MKLRDYQIKAVEAVFENWKQHRSTLIVLPTGCGKTVVFAEIIRRLAETEGVTSCAMVLAHREELIRQAADKIATMTGLDAQIEMGDFTVTPMFGKMPPVVVSTVQTQTTGRMTKFDPKDFGCLVIDEAHHATAASYRKCIEHYFANPDCRLVGVTATPDRADETALGIVFESVACEYAVTDAIHDGWLVPVRQQIVKAASLDFSGISTCAGDLNRGELAEVLEEERNLHAIAGPVREICGARRAIIFAASVKQAERLCEILNRGQEGAGTESNNPTIEQSNNPTIKQSNNSPTPTSPLAAWLCGKTDKEERRRILADFAAGKTRFVVNVGVLTEGFDDAGVEVVVMARPTKSRALYAQMAGRATRPAAEIAGRLGELETAEERRALIASSSKPSCMILDFAGNAGRHKLVTTLDILGGEELDDETRELARQKIMNRSGAANDGQEAEEAVKEARSEIKARKEREARRRAFISATATYVTTSVDPFNVFDLPPPDNAYADSFGKCLSWKQQAFCREVIGIDPSRHSYAYCKQLIDECFRRRNANLASMKQLKFLTQHGIHVPMRFEEASRTIERLKRGS